MLYHTNTIGASNEGFTLGLLKAVELARARGVDVVFLVHTIKMLKGGVFEDVLGEKKVAAFAKRRTIMVDDVTVQLETEQIRSGHMPVVLFAPFISGELLSKALADTRVKDAVYVPWAEEERFAFVLAHPDAAQF